MNVTCLEINSYKSCESIAFLRRLYHKFCPDIIAEYAVGAWKTYLHFPNIKCSFVMPNVDINYSLTFVDGLRKGMNIMQSDNK